MEQSTIVIIASVLVIVVIAAFCVWIVLKDKLAYRRLHPLLVDRWDQVATTLGLSWVVPIDHVREQRTPPALNGKVSGRNVYLALQDESGDESLRARWELVVHVSLGKGLAPKKERKRILKSLKRRRSIAELKKGLLIVHRPGLHLTLDEIVAVTEDCIDGASRLD